MPDELYLKTNPFHEVFEPAGFTLADVEEVVAAAVDLHTSAGTAAEGAARRRIRAALDKFPEMVAALLKEAPRCRS